MSSTAVLKLHSGGRGENVKRRKTVRFPLNLQVHFTWHDEKGKRLWGEGETRDISTKGAYVFGSVCPPKRCVLKMDFLLPALKKSSRSLEIETMSSVVRVEALEGKGRGFAVVNRRMMLTEKDFR